MRIDVPHNTTKTKAREVVHRKAQLLLAQFGDKADDVEHEWRADTLYFKGKARGVSVGGTLEVTDAAVVVDVKLPLLAKPFESRIRQTVERELEVLFKTA